MVLLIHISYQEFSPEPCGSFSRLIPIELAILTGGISLTLFSLLPCIAALRIHVYRISSGKLGVIVIHP